MGGKSKKQTIGYWYKMDVLLTLCHKVDEVAEIRAADRVAWLGSVTESKTLGILRSTLFGGEKREGGLEGMCDVMLGEDDMEFNSFLGSSMRNAGITGPIPTYRGLTSLFFRGAITIWPEFPIPESFQRVYSRPNSITDLYGNPQVLTTGFRWSAMSPYFKPLKVKVRRFTKGWREDISKIGGLSLRVPTAFYFTLDYSGSMADSGRAEMQRDAIREVLDYIDDAMQAPNSARVDIMISGFGSKTGTYSKDDDGVVSTGLTDGNGARTWIKRTAATSSDITELKAWLNAGTGYNTYFPAGVVDAPAFFAASPAVQKILFFLTDGQPSDTGGDSATTITNAAKNILNTIPALAVFGMSIDLSDTTYLQVLDNTINDGVPVIRSVFNYSAMTNIIISALSGQFSANPAHIIRDLLTNNEYGMGYPTSDIDDDVFQAVAEQLYNEQFGLSFKWDQNMEIREFIQNVLNHVGGVQNQNRSTGKLFIKLIRNDYSIPSLMEFNESNCNVELFTRSSSSGIVNEVTVRYTTATGETDAVTVQDLASINSSGQIISQELDFPGITNTLLAIRVAQRELESRIKPVARLRIRTDRTAFKLYEGEVFKLVWPQLNISQMVCRILKMDMGTLQEGHIIIEAVEDVFGFPETSYLEPQYIDTPATSDNAEPSPFRYITETPYYDLARTMSTADLDYVEDDDSYIDVYAEAPNSNYLDFALWTATGSATVEERATSNHAAIGELVTGLGRAESNVIEVTNLDSIIELLQDENAYGIINGEYVAITNYDLDNNTISIDRGVLDTVPIVHVADSKFILNDGTAAQDDVNYVTGETIKIRVQTFKPSNNLSIDSTPEDNYTFLGRQGRPYPPGKLRVNGMTYPTNIGYLDGLSITWAHRNRLTQTADIIAQSFDSITPELGNTYNLRIYSETDVLLREVTGLTGTSYEYTTTTELADMGGNEEPLWDAVELLLNLNGANGSTDITDISSSPKTCIAIGNSQISNSQSKFGGASAVFDGLGDYIIVNYESSMDPNLTADQDFTIELWLRPNSTTAGQSILDWRATNVSRGMLITQATGTKIRFAIGDSNTSAFEVDIQSITNITTGTWYHLAFIKYQDQYLLYINGALDTIVSNSVLVSTGVAPMLIGADIAGANFLNGNIDDFRYTRAARYIPTYTEPSAELSSTDPHWASVVLLLNMNGANNSTTFTDSSTSAKTVTALGNSKISTAESKFGGASALFDGADDVLSLADSSDWNFGAGDFTIEAWVRLTALPGTDGFSDTIVGQRTSTSSQYAFAFQLDNSQLTFRYTTEGTTAIIVNAPCDPFAINTWYHVVVQRKSNSILFFTNGKFIGGGNIGSASIFNSTAALTIGGASSTINNEFTGYIDDLRITKGVARYSADIVIPVAELSQFETVTDPLWSDTTVLLNFNGANGSTTFTESVSAISFTGSGSAAISTTQSKFNGASLGLNGSTQYISAADNTAFKIGSGNFTIEAWIYLTGVPTVYTPICSHGDDVVNGSYFFGIDNATMELGFYYNTPEERIEGGTVTLNTWYHVAVSHDGTTYKLFLNGQIVATSVDALFGTVVGEFRVGRGRATSTNYLQGYVDDLRLTKATRYTTTFLPPIYQLGQYVNISPELNSTLRFEFEAEREGLVSWQKHNITLNRYAYGISAQNQSSATVTLTTAIRLNASPTSVSTISATLTP